MKSTLQPITLSELKDNIINDIQKLHLSEQVELEAYINTFLFNHYHCNDNNVEIDFYEDSQKFNPYIAIQKAWESLHNRRYSTMSVEDRENVLNIIKKQLNLYTNKAELTLAGFKNKLKEKI